MPLDEHDLGASTHLGRAGEDLLDVTRLIARRNDHRDAKAVCGKRSPRARPGNDEVRQREVIEGPKFDQEAVGQNVDARCPDGPQHFLPAVHQFEVRQVQQVRDILDGQPVLVQRWSRQLHPRRRGERRLPEPAVIVDDDSCPGVRDAGDLREDRLHIPEVVQQVREDDDVEGAVESGEIVRVGDLERQLRMPLSGQGDHGG